MRRVPAVNRVGVAVVVVLLAVLLVGCANRPNDLRHYDRIESEDASTSAQPPPGASVASMRWSPPSTERVLRAMLGAGDLSAEGVAVAEKPLPTHISALPDCAVSLADRDRPAVGSTASWRYPSGSMLREYVLRYANVRPTTVISAARAKSGCTAAGGAARRVLGPLQPVPTGADAQLFWCAHEAGSFGCTVLLGRGELLGILTVTSGSQSRAAEAVQRLAPAAAVALRRG